MAMEGGCALLQTANFMNESVNYHMMFAAILLNIYSNT